jgi:Domain of unknown function (DUF6458)
MGGRPDRAGDGPSEGEIMGLGGAVALIAIGLILAFAVNVSIAGVDVHLIGLILAGVGVLWLVLFFLVWAPRRRAAVEARTVRRNSAVDPATGDYVEERRIYDDRI